MQSQGEESCNLVGLGFVDLGGGAHGIFFLPENNCQQCMVYVHARGKERKKKVDVACDTHFFSLYYSSPNPLHSRCYSLSAIEMLLRPGIFDVHVK